MKEKIKKATAKVWTCITNNILEITIGLIVLAFLFTIYTLTFETVKTFGLNKYYKETFVDRLTETEESLDTSLDIDIAE